MTWWFPSIRRTLHAAAWVVVAAVVLLRPGPLCESAAMAAPVAAVRAVDCAMPVDPAPARKAPPIDCRVPCILLPPATAPGVVAPSAARLVPWGRAPPRLVGRSPVPVTPPPEG